MSRPPTAADVGRLAVAYDEAQTNANAAADAAADARRAADAAAARYMAAKWEANHAEPGELSIRIRVCGSGPDDYGTIRVDVPLDRIDWTVADAPRPGREVQLKDLYEVTLELTRPGVDQIDTWDRDIAGGGQ